MVPLFWRSINIAIPLVTQHLIWEVGDGKQVLISKDPWVGTNTEYTIIEAYPSWQAKLPRMTLNMGHYSKLDKPSQTINKIKCITSKEEDTLKWGANPASEDLLGQIGLF